MCGTLAFWRLSANNGQTAPFLTQSVGEPPVADYFVAFWNVENLFDVQNSTRRTEKLQRAIGSELKGWNPGLLKRKIQQLGEVVSAMNGGNGPDLLGVCEVENDHVLNLLVSELSGLGRNYQNWQRKPPISVSSVARAPSIGSC